MFYKRIIICTCLIFPFISIEFAFGLACNTNVTAVAIGPPTWEYEYSSPAGIGSMNGFRITGGCDVIGAAAPLGWNASPRSDGADYITFTPPSCGSAIRGFFLTSTASTSSALIMWSDLVGPSSGFVDGPVCVPTTTPTATHTSTGSPFVTATPTPTSATPSSTPTLGPGTLLLVGAPGPPVWTYEWFGTTDGFLLKCTCCTTSILPTDWGCISQPSGLYCRNFRSPDPTPKWYQYFEFIEAPPGAKNSSILYQSMPSGPNVSIDGPECKPPTNTPGPTNTPLPSPTTTGPTFTYTFTPTESPTRTPTITGSIPTITPTWTPTNTVMTNTPVLTPTWTPTNTVGVFTDTPTSTPTYTSTDILTSTATKGPVTIPVASAPTRISLVFLLSLAAVLCVLGVRS